MRRSRRARKFVLFYGLLGGVRAGLGIPFKFRNHDELEKNNNLKEEKGSKQSRRT
jgi:hypothetical protein